MLRIRVLVVVLSLVLLLSAGAVNSKIYAQESSPGIDPLSLILRMFSLNFGGIADKIKGVLDVTEAPGVKNMRELFTEIESKVGVPSKVIEAVFIIESPGQYKAFSGEDIARYAQPGQRLPNCRPNECSAAGPMQMTTGADGSGDTTCPKCGAGFCPNAWSTYRSAVNTFGGLSHQPEACNLRDNIYAAASKLKNDSGATGLQWTQDQIYRAATRYYGSCGEKYRYVRLGNRTYCEFLWMFYNANL